MATDDPIKKRKSERYKLACRALDCIYTASFRTPGPKPRRSPVKIICKGGVMLDKPVIVDSAGYGSATAKRADELRMDATDSELAVADALCHLGFAHSVPKCGYYLDFYNPELRLAIEIDGSSHDGRQNHDRRRDAVLWRNGIKTWRYSAGFAVSDPKALVAAITNRIANYRPSA